MRRIQIIDLDGCIADDRHRRSHLNPVLQKDHRPESDAAREAMWHEYHKHCFLDTVANLHSIQEEHVVVITGRPLKYWTATDMWLREVAFIRPLYMIMRNNFDRTSSVGMKRRAVNGLLDHNSYGIDRDELVLAIDDREDIVLMYQQAFGLEAKVVRIGDHEEHYHAHA